MAKQIKTVIRGRDYPEEFDEEVNRLLRSGWKLIKRDVLPGLDTKVRAFFPVLYAELEKKEEDRDDA